MSLLLLLLLLAICANLNSFIILGPVPLILLVYTMTQFEYPWARLRRDAADRNVAGKRAWLSSKSRIKVIVYPQGRLSASCKRRVSLRPFCPRLLIKLSYSPRDFQVWKDKKGSILTKDRKSGCEADILKYLITNSANIRYCHEVKPAISWLLMLCPGQTIKMSSKKEAPDCDYSFPSKPPLPHHHEEPPLSCLLKDYELRFRDCKFLHWTLLLRLFLSRMIALPGHQDDHWWI